MRKPLIAGNWKMYKTTQEAAELIKAIGSQLLTQPPLGEVVVCPPFTALSRAATVIEGHNFPIGLGAQNMHWEEEGAFTGEVSPLMLKELAVDYVILGHSERRQFFAETDAQINKKIKAAFKYGLKPIFCVGESLAQREQGQTSKVITEQVQMGLADLTTERLKELVIAYEPVWAIGTGRHAQPQDANDVIRHIRALVSALFSPEVGVAVRILYGGSVKPDNVAGFMAEPEIDGALVGGASLNAADFLAIIKAVPTKLAAN